MRKTNEFENDTLKAECIEKKFEFFRDDAENIENNANISRIYIYIYIYICWKNLEKNMGSKIVLQQLSQF